MLSLSMCQRETIFQQPNENDLPLKAFAPKDNHVVVPHFEPTPSSGRCSARFKHKTWNHIFRGFCDVSSYPILRPTGLIRTLMATKVLSRPAGKDFQSLFILFFVMSKKRQGVGLWARNPIPRKARSVDQLINRWILSFLQYRSVSDE